MSARIEGDVSPQFRRVADAFRRQLPDRGPGGAALCVYHRGVPVVDIWAGSRDTAGTPWTPDTLALSFSTTKGVAATVLHVLAGRGQLDYDAPVARYWPAFAQNGKAAITVRQLLCHEAGLYDIRAMIDSAEKMRDWAYMLARLEQAAPAHAPGEMNGYHGLTFGWLAGGLAEQVTGKPFAQLLRECVSEPLQLDGCYIGVPDSELARCAQLITTKMPAQQLPRVDRGPRRRGQPLARQVASRALRLTGFDPDTLVQGLAPRGMNRFDWNSPDTHRACIPGAAGMFNARSLARLYAALGNGGELDGARLMPRATVAAMSRVQDTRRGQVVPLPMHWRLGYHRVFTTGPRTPHAFGHFGYGGSGAWCDPSRQLAVGYVVNYGVGTPFGDLRIWRINTDVIRAVDSLPTLLRQWLPGGTSAGVSTSPTR